MDRSREFDDLGVGCAESANENGAGAGIRHGERVLASGGDGGKRYGEGQRQRSAEPRGAGQPFDGANDGGRAIEEEAGHRSGEASGVGGSQGSGREREDDKPSSHGSVSSYYEPAPPISRGR